MARRKRYCGMCDQMVVPDVAGDCGACGFETVAGNPYAGENPRQKGDDDGLEYSNPRDRMEGRE